MHLFRSAAPDEVRKAYEASVTDASTTSLKDRREAIQHDLQRVRMAFKGGPEAIEFLMKKTGETPTDWRSRREHYRNVPVTRIVTRTLAWMLYGTPPSIEVWIGDKPPGVRAQLLAVKRGETLARDETSDAYSKWVQDTLDLNRNDQLMVRAGVMRIRDGLCAVKLWGVDDANVPTMPFTKVRMDVHKREDAIPIYDPDDPDVLLAALEYRGDGKWIEWTTDEVIAVNDAMEPIGLDIGEHPVPGTIPFAFFGDGETLIPDLPDYQKVLINKHSTGWAVERATAFPIGVSTGTPLNKEERLKDGTKGINLGGGMRMMMYADPQGGFSLVSPDADLAGLRTSYEGELKEALSLGGGVPEDIGGASGPTPEQPTTIALRWIRSFINRDTLIHDAKAFEDSRQHILAAFAADSDNAFGIGTFESDAADWDVTFTKTPLPHDDRNERDLAMKEVDSNVRLKASYVADFVEPQANSEELTEIMAELDEQGKVQIPDFGFEQPPDFEDEEV